MIWARQEQFNNLTWDIELNPWSFWLFMRDIDEASLNLRTAIYSWNINLTADLYKQLESLSEKKYNAIEPDWSINTTRLADTSMTGKTAWLYMNHQRMWYWTWIDWKAFIWNTWEMWLWSITESNYLHWTWTELIMKWTLLLPWDVSIEDYIDNEIWDVTNPTWDSLWNKPSVLQNANQNTPTPSWTWFQLTATHMWYYSWWSWRTFMKNDWTFWLSWSWSNSLEWDWSALNINWNITATSWSFNWSVSVSNTWNFYWWKTTYWSSTPWFWLWYDWSAYKFKIWNSTNNIDWDWNTLNITGNITLSNTIPNNKVAWLGSLATENSVSYWSITWNKPPTNADVTLSAIEGALTLTWWWLVLASWWASIRWWQTAYDTWSWFWLWDVSWTTKFSLWDESWNKLLWTWSALEITGDITWSTITWWTIKTSSDWLRVELSSNQLKVYDWQLDSQKRIQISSWIFWWKSKGYIQFLDEFWDNAWYLWGESSPLIFISRGLYTSAPLIIWYNNNLTTNTNDIIMVWSSNRIQRNWSASLLDRIDINKWWWELYFDIDDWNMKLRRYNPNGVSSETIILWSGEWTIWTDLSIWSSTWTIVRIDSSTWDNAIIPNASTDVAWVITTWAQTIAWSKTFSWILKKTEAFYFTPYSWTVDLNYNNWSYQIAVLNGNITFTISNPNRNFLILVIINWWNFTVTWPNIFWAWWTVPVLTMWWYDIISILYDGWRYYWDYQTNFHN